MTETKPILGITIGDPASVGPEIALKALSERKVFEISKPILIGDSELLKLVSMKLGIDLVIHRIEKIDQAKYQFGIVDILDLNNVDTKMLQYGVVSSMAGKASFEYVKKAIDLALENEIDGTVTGPINKESINKAGNNFSGHTEIYAHYTNTKKYAMLLVDEDLRVIHVSTHVSLREACDLVKKDRILEVVDLLDDACKRFDVPDPKIGIAGLNPHASDGGLFGYEEERDYGFAEGQTDSMDLLHFGEDSYCKLAQNLELKNYSSN